MSVSPPYPNYPSYQTRPAPVEDSSLLSQPNGKPGSSGLRKKITLVIILVVLIFATGAIATFTYQTLSGTHPSKLLPANTLFYLEIANLNNPKENNTWQSLDTHLRQFPVYFNTDFSEILSEAFPLFPTINENESLLDSFRSERNIIVAFTDLPNPYQSLPDFSLTAFNNTFAPNQPTPPGHVAGTTTSPEENTKLVIFIPLSESPDLAELLNALLQDDSISIEPLDNNIFAVELNQTTSATTQMYVTLVSGYLALANEKDSLIQIQENGSLTNTFSSEKSFASTPAYSTFAELQSPDSLLSYIVNTGSDVYQQIISNQPTANIKPEEIPPYITGQIDVTNEGFEIISNIPLSENSQVTRLTTPKEKLIAILPEKLVEHWVSIYFEQEIEFKEDSICSKETTTNPYIQTFCEEGFLGFTDSDLTSLLSKTSQVAFLVAPRYDNQAPHGALVLSTTEEEAVLYQTGEELFSILESYFTQYSTELQATLEASDSPVPSQLLTPLQLQQLQVPTITRRTTDHFGKTLITLESTLATLPFQPTLAVHENKLIFAFDETSAKEILDALRGYNPNSPLLENGSVQYQLGHHSEPSASFSYGFPRGTSGLIRWLANYVFPIPDNPYFNNLFTIIESHLLVTRTVGTSLTSDDSNLQQKTFIQITPLPKQQKQHTIQLLKELKNQSPFTPLTP